MAKWKRTGGRLSSEDEPILVSKDGRWSVFPEYVGCGNIPRRHFYLKDNTEIIDGRVWKKIKNLKAFVEQQK